MRPSRTGGSVPFASSAGSPPSAPTISQPDGYGGDINASTVSGATLYNFYSSNTSGSGYTLDQSSASQTISFDSIANRYVICRAANSFGESPNSNQIDTG